MTRRRSSRFAFQGILFFLLPISSFFISASTALLILEVKVGHIICWRGRKNIEIPVYVANVADSIAIDTIVVSRLDTTMVHVINGSLDIRPCGDANGDNRVKILDITYLINCLYRSGQASSPMESGDMNKNQLVNVLDITGLINSLYRGGGPPDCD